MCAILLSWRTITFFCFLNIYNINFHILIDRLIIINSLIRLLPASFFTWFVLECSQLSYHSWSRMPWFMIHNSTDSTGICPLLIMLISKIFYLPTLMSLLFCVCLVLSSRMPSLLLSSIKKICDPRKHIPASQPSRSDHGSMEKSSLYCRIQHRFSVSIKLHIRPLWSLWSAHWPNER